MYPTSKGKESGSWCKKVHLFLLLIIYPNLYFSCSKNTKEANREVPILRVDEETFTNLREYLPTITSLYPKLTHNIYATYIYIWQKCLLFMFVNF